MDEREKKHEEFKKELVKEMKKLGADENDLSLISNTLIENSILNDRSPEDVAWAIMQ